MSVINTNIPTTAGARPLNPGQEALGRSLGRLASASPQVKTAEDSTGLRDARKMEASSLRVSAKSTSIQNGISYVQTTDRFMHGIAQALSRLSELAKLSSDGTKNASDNAIHGQEFKALQDQLRDTIGGSAAGIGGTTGVASPRATFNGKALFGPSSDGAVTADSLETTGEPIEFPDTNLRGGAMLKLIQQDAGGNYLLNAADDNALSVVSDATEGLTNQRAALVAVGSRLEFAGAMLRVESENLSAAVAGIRDADAAEQSTQLAKYNIIAQSATAMGAQANQSPNSVLKLLQN